MEEFILKMIPIVLFFGLGYLLKAIKLFDEKDAGLFLKYVFYISMPSLSITSLMETPLEINLLILPFIPLATMGFTWITAKLFLTVKKQNRKTVGTFLAGSMIMNTGFTLPFFMAGFGSEGFMKAILFDIGNSLLIFTWVYYIAVKAGGHENINRREVIKKVLILPPLWALITGIALKQASVSIPVPVYRFLELAGQPTIPLIMLSLGLYFQPQIKNINKALAVIVIRMAGGLLAGLVLVKLLPLDPVSKIVVIASSAAPVGYNTLVFSIMEDLDRNFAATLVSMSILTGIFWVPFLFWIFK